MSIKTQVSEENEQCQSTLEAMTDSDVTSHEKILTVIDYVEQTEKIYEQMQQSEHSMEHLRDLIMDRTNTCDEMINQIDNGSKKSTNLKRGTVRLVLSDSAVAHNVRLSEDEFKDFMENTDIEDNSEESIESAEESVQEIISQLRERNQNIKDALSPRRQIVQQFDLEPSDNLLLQAIAKPEPKKKKGLWSRLLSPLAARVFPRKSQSQIAAEREAGRRLYNLLCDANFYNLKPI